jgi:hypothetical protein
LVLTGLRDLLEELDAVDDAASPRAAVAERLLLLGAPGRDPLDALVLELTRVLVRGEPVTLEILSMDLMVGEVISAIEAKAPAAVVVPSLPPAGLTPARQLCMRVHARAPAMPLVAARLGDPEADVADRVALLETAGCTHVAPSLDELRATIQRIVRATSRGAPVAVAVAGGGG